MGDPYDHQTEGSSHAVLACIALLLFLGLLTAVSGYFWLARRDVVEQARQMQVRKETAQIAIRKDLAAQGDQMHAVQAARHNEAAQQLVDRVNGRPENATAPQVFRIDAAGQIHREARPLTVDELLEQLTVPSSRAIRLEVHPDCPVGDVLPLQKRLEQSGIDVTLQLTPVE